MAYVKLFAATLVAFFVGTECLRIGLGRYDVTGPSVEVPFVSTFCGVTKWFFSLKLVQFNRWDTVA